MSSDTEPHLSNHPLACFGSFAWIKSSHLPMTLMNPDGKESGQTFTGNSADANLEHSLWDESPSVARRESEQQWREPERLQEILPGGIILLKQCWWIACDPMQRKHRSEREIEGACVNVRDKRGNRGEKGEGKKAVMSLQ